MSIFITSPTHPYWGDPTASIDWCENNYAVSFLIAEFWNTVSNVWMIFAGICGFCWKSYYGFETRFLIADLLIMIIGLGSVAFHGSLLFSTQLADELPMIWSMLVWNYLLLQMNDFEDGGFPKLGSYMALFGFLWTAFSFWTHLYFPIIFQVVFGILVVTCFSIATKMFLDAKHNAGLFYLLYVVAFVLGFALWVIDQRYCEPLLKMLGGFWWHRFVGSLHGYWHVCGAIHSYCGSLYAAYHRAWLLNWKPDIRYLYLIPYISIRRKY